MIEPAASAAAGGIDAAVAEYVAAYVHGWAVSRAALRPRAVRHGWHVPTGLAAEPERCVLTDGTEAEVRRVRERLWRPGSCLKFAGDRADWSWLAADGWEENPLGWFMTRELGESPSDRAATCDGGTWLSAVESRCRVDGELAMVELRVDDRVVASGRAGLWRDWAVPDRIRTAPEFRRLGLGSRVMRRLLEVAYRHGARRAVLDASSDGRELYRALGWRTVAGQFGINRPVAGRS